MLRIKQFVLDRLKERSTWYGIIAMAGSAGAVIDPSLREDIVLIGVTLAGIVATLTADK